MSRERPIALLSVQEGLKWESCKSISVNLARAYRGAIGSSARFFRYPAGADLATIWQLATELAASGAGRLVFLDHVPHPLPLLEALRHVYGDRALPGCVFHTYGDFTLYPGSWLEAGKFLAGTRTLFLCASRRQQGLIGALLTAGEGGTALQPFPVDDRFFAFSPPDRRAWRRKLGLQRDDFAFLYSGRVSLQKNLRLAIAELAELARKDERAHFLIAGGDDDLGGPVFGLVEPVGAYGAELRALMDALPSALRKRFRWLGSVKPAVMRGLYSAADAFVSLGLHHDEDFGMSVAEAQLAGLPCVLSDWGGFSSFVESAEEGALVPVSLAKGGLSLALPPLRSALAALVARPRSANERARLSARKRARFGLAATARGLAAIHARPLPIFRGFAPRLSWLSFEASVTTAAFPGGPSCGGIYEKVYEPYYRKTEHAPLAH